MFIISDFWHFVNMKVNIYWKPTATKLIRMDQIGRRIVETNNGWKEILDSIIYLFRGTKDIIDSPWEGS